MSAPPPRAPNPDHATGDEEGEEAWAPEQAAAPTERQQPRPPARDAGDLPAPSDEAGPESGERPEARAQA